VTTGAGTAIGRLSYQGRPVRVFYVVRSTFAVVTAKDASASALEPLHEPTVLSTSARKPPA